VKLSHPSNAMPGQTVPLTVELSDPDGKPQAGEVTLWLVDKAVLSLAEEARLDPVPDYITRVDTHVDVHDTRNLGFGRIPFAEMPGGGDGDDLADDALDKLTVRDDFRPDMSQMFQRQLEEGMKGELKRLGEEQTVSLTLNESLSHTRLDDRRQLLAGLDRIKRKVDASGMMGAMDRFQQQAVGILTSGDFADAMDLSQEDPSVVARYTASSTGQGVQSTTSEGRDSTRKFLLARRLVEAGVRCVSVSISDFDTHSSNFDRMRHLLPIVDHGLVTLVNDLDERGMLDNISIVVWGEFGRTPRINDKNGGRDHWPRVGPALLAGGGMRTGQVIGETDRTAGTAISRPVHYKDIFATLYRNLGIDARQITIEDPSGRPQYLLDAGEPMSELA